MSASLDEMNGINRRMPTLDIEFVREQGACGGGYHANIHGLGDLGGKGRVQ